MPKRSIQRKLSFNFGWLALKLMGKSLYSNAWSAISELVANGFDANAKDVYVFVDASNKKNATIPVIIQGCTATPPIVPFFIKAYIKAIPNI